MTQKRLLLVLKLSVSIPDNNIAGTDPVFFCPWLFSGRGVPVLSSTRFSKLDTGKLFCLFFAGHSGPAPGFFVIAPAIRILMVCGQAFLADKKAEIKFARYPTSHYHTTVIKKKAPTIARAFAEREGFEPPDRSHGQWFSRPPHSTTLPSLLRMECKNNSIFLETKIY